jgi:hypothetical protein
MRRRRLHFRELHVTLLARVVRDLLARVHFQAAYGVDHHAHAVERDVRALLLVQLRDVVVSGPLLAGYEVVALARLGAPHAQTVSGVLPAAVNEIEARFRV